MLKYLELKNFMGFPEIAIELGPGINVFIGENGVGKTNLLKAAYGLCSAGPMLSKHPDWDASKLEEELTRTFIRLFLPLNDKLGNMRHRGAKGAAGLTAHFEKDQEITAIFTEKTKRLELSYTDSLQSISGDPVFIPSKEVLSFMLGFTSLYEKYRLSFDQTYQDICLLLDLPEIRKENLSLESQKAINIIHKICKGNFIFHGKGKVTFKTNNKEYSINSVSEGLRKFGMLSQLIKTGSIQPGISGPIFWDEPDINLNPKVIRSLVEILFNLSNNGQQIILTTHDYILVKWLENISCDRNKVLFYSVYKNEKNIYINKYVKYSQIQHNPIDETIDDLLNHYIIKNNILS